MHQILAAVSMTVFPCLCTALGAGAVFLARPAPGGGAGQGLAGGVMLAACVFNLLLPAAESGWLAPAAGLVAGAALLLLAERLAGALENGSGKKGPVSGWGAALAAVLAGGMLAGLMPWLLALAAGVMLAAAMQEPLAAAVQQGAPGVLAVAVGFGLLMALNLALG